MMELDIRSSTELKSGQQGIGEGAEAESWVEQAANGPYSGTEVRPCAATETMNVVNDAEFCTSVQVMDGVVDNMEANCYTSTQTKEVVDNAELQTCLECGVKDVIDITESKSLPEIQLKQALDHAEAEPCTGTCAHEVLSKEDLESVGKNHKREASEEYCVKKTEKEAQEDANSKPNEVTNDTQMEACAENLALEMCGNDNFELFTSNVVKEKLTDFSLVPYPKNGSNTNDDTYSEVSDPNISPKHVISNLTTCSQPLDVLRSDHGGCGEITSACSQSSSADGNFSEEEHNKCKLEPGSPNCVVLEIPKHVRPTGIRKITFKFSKRKDGNDSGLSIDVKPLAEDNYHGDVYENRLSLSAAESLTSNGLHVRQSPSSCVPNRELKMSKKIVPDTYPTNVKKLLSTGILEGARVKYISMSGEVCNTHIVYFCSVTCMIFIIRVLFLPNLALNLVFKMIARKRFRASSRNVVTYVVVVSATSPK